MNRKIIILLMLSQCKVYLCLKNAAIDDPSQLFTDTADQKYTDQRTSEYLERKYTTEGVVKTLKSAIYEHVCHTRSEMRQKFCELLLETDENGFRFGSSEAPSKCNRKTWTVQFLTLAKSKQTKLWTFSCQPVLYTDLESGEERTLPYIYKISNASPYTSAILYVLKDANTKDLYPQKYIENINFKKTRRFYYTPSSESEMWTDRISGTYAVDKQITSPYNKFVRFHSSINVCGLRQAPRIYLCRQAIQKVSTHVAFMLDFDDYREAGCRKYGVQSMANDELENHPRPKNELYMFRCPPIKIDHAETLLKSVYLFYVASNAYHHSITLFVRDNDKKEGARQKLNINELRMRPIFEHIRRERFLPEPLVNMNAENTGLSKSYQEIEDEINSSCDEVRMPLTLKRFIKPNLRIEKSEAENVLQSTRDRWLADQVLISFSKVKMTKQIYSRFMMTHKSIDICHLTTLQKILLCNVALKELRTSRDEYIFSKMMYPICLRRKVTPTVLEADDYETNHFSMWECPTDGGHRNEFFVGKNHLNDSATVYKRIELAGQDYYYPYSLITKIDRHKLVEDVLLRVSFSDYT